MNIIFAILIFVFATTNLYADTIIMKGKKVIKGLVIEEYVDRIIFGTIDGEKEIFRKDIETIEYDTPEQNLFQIGREYEEKLLYEKAAFYYKRALEINPDYKEARDAFLSSHALMWRREESRAKKELEFRRLVLDWKKDKTKKESVAVDQDKNELLKENLGFELLINEGNFIVAKVIGGSSAYNAGVKEGDVLLAIWGKLIRYSKFEDVFAKLDIPQFSEIKVTVERDIILENCKTGISFKVGYEGLNISKIESESIAEKAGLREGEIVIYIDNSPTRYMPLERAIELIKSKIGPFTLRIRRDIILRRL